jgi:hypothetical protein
MKIIERELVLLGTPVVAIVLEWADHICLEICETTCL